MKKTTNVYKIWQIAYPIFLYYVVSSLVYFGLEYIIGTENRTYMLRQMICTACTIPVTWAFYRQDGQAEKLVFGQDKKTLFWKLRVVVLVMISMGALGITVNNVLAMTPLLKLSEGFATANQSLFGSSLVYELLASVLVVPIGEELLYRGVVYKRLRGFWGSGPAILVSALLFGVIHGNVVQFIYSMILGIFLALILEQTKRLWPAILGHMVVNLIAILRAETGFLSFAYEATVPGIAVTVGFALVAAAGFYLLFLKNSD